MGRAILPGLLSCNPGDEKGAGRTDQACDLLGVPRSIGDGQAVEASTVQRGPERRIPVRHREDAALRKERGRLRPRRASSGHCDGDRCEIEAGDPKSVVGEPERIRTRTTPDVKNRSWGTNPRLGHRLHQPSRRLRRVPREPGIRNSGVQLRPIDLEAWPGWHAGWGLGSPGRCSSHCDRYASGPLTLAVRTSATDLRKRAIHEERSGLLPGLPTLPSRSSRHRVVRATSARKGWGPPLPRATKPLCEARRRAVRVP